MQRSVALLRGLEMLAELFSALSSPSALCHNRKVQLRMQRSAALLRGLEIGLNRSLSLFNIGALRTQSFLPQFYSISFSFSM